MAVETSSGVIVQRSEHDEWGVVTANTAEGFIPFGFGSGLNDPDTGLIRFGARDYDPEIGRWTTKDPIRFRARDPNLYRYVVGDPVNYRDPSGLLILPQDPGSAASLARIASDPSLQPFIDRLAGDPNVTVTISASPLTQDMIDHQGATTRSFTDDPTWIYIDYNPDAAPGTNGLTCGGVPVDWLIAHELGHAYSYQYGNEFLWYFDLVGPEAGGHGHGIGIYFENQLRPSDQQRSYE